MERKISRHLLALVIFLISSGLLVSACDNRGRNNRLLSNIHAGYPDCYSCHGGFGAAGSVFNDFNGMSIAQGVQINMVQVPDNTVYTFPRTDGMGNFYTTASISGVFMMYAGEVGVVRPSTVPHLFPQWRSCNQCHVPRGASFNGYAAPTGTIKWRP